MKKIFFLIIITFFIFFYPHIIKADDTTKTIYTNYQKITKPSSYTNYVVIYNKSLGTYSFFDVITANVYVSDDGSSLKFDWVNNKVNVKQYNSNNGNFVFDYNWTYGFGYVMSNIYIVDSSIPILCNGESYDDILSNVFNQPILFNNSEFDSSLGKLNIKSTRYLDKDKHIYHDFFTIDTTTSTDVDITQSGYGIKCYITFYGKDNYSYSTDYFDLTDYRFNFDWKNKNFSGLSLPSQPDFDKVTQYRLYLFPFKEENGLIKRGLFSSVSYGDYTSNGSYLNTRYSSGHRVGAHRPQGSNKELDTFITPLPVSHGSGFFLSDNDTLINKYIYEYHYPGEPDETVIYDITNNITNPDSIVDVPVGDSISDFDFGTIKSFLTGLYNFLFKLSKVLILWLGLPPDLATILNLGLYVIVFLIFGSLFKKLF